MYEEVPVYKYVIIKDVKGDRYTYHDARAFMFDDLIHVYSDGSHVVFIKNEIVMFILKGYDPVDEKDNLHECD